jgi:catechol 2,3-dioxygenase-like lactoylglutathione lyase family enzyme
MHALSCEPVTPVADAGPNRALYPGIVTGLFHATWDFYTTHLGFRTLAEHDTYVHLAHPDGPQLGVLREETDGQESELICATRGTGFWINLEVPNADEAYVRLKEAGVPIGRAPEDKAWGERQFLIRDPNGVLIYLAQKLRS